MRSRWWVVGGLVAAAAILALGALYAGMPLGPPKSCTAVGCALTYGVTVQEGAAANLRGPGRTATLCVDGECVVQDWHTAFGSPQIATSDTERGDASSASFTIDEADIEIAAYHWSGDVEAKESFPNGKECDGVVCRSIVFAVENEKLVPV